MSFFRILSFVLGLCAITASLCGQDAVHIVAEAEPTTLMVGDSGNYTVRFINAPSLPDLPPPEVEGLRFSQSAQQGSFTQIINGRVSADQRLTWSFQSTREGQFTIPARSVVIQGRQLSIPAVQIQVVPMSEERRSRHFLQIDLPDGPFFLGQAIPATLTLAVRDDLDIGQISFPRKVGDAFSTSSLTTEPERQIGTLNNRRYRTFSWPVLITPLTEGQQSLQFEQSLSVIARTNGRLSPFPSMFAPRGREDPVTLASDLPPLDIIPVPTEGQPAFYTDAIGDFSVSAHLASRNLTVGEPVTLSLTISGSGNFDRITPPVLEDSEQWRFYPPKRTFTPDDALGLVGALTFDFILLPRSDAITEVPGIDFATFDPVARQYVITHIDPEPVSVAPATDDRAANLQFSPANADAANTAAQAPLPTLGSFSRSQTPWQRPAFIGLNALGAVGLAAFILFSILDDRRRNDPLAHLRGQRDRELRQALRAFTDATKANDPAAILQSATLAIRLQSLNALPRGTKDPRTLVPDELSATLAANGLESSHTDAIARLFHEADAALFANINPNPEAIAQLVPQIHSALNAIARLANK